MYIYVYTYTNRLNRYIWSFIYSIRYKSWPASCLKKPVGFCSWGTSWDQRCNNMGQDEKPNFFGLRLQRGLSPNDQPCLMWVVYIYIPLWKMMEFVSWDDMSNIYIYKYIYIYMESHKSHVPHHQPVYTVYTHVSPWRNCMLRCLTTMALPRKEMTHPSVVRVDILARSRKVDLGWINSRRSTNPRFNWRSFWPPGGPGIGPQHLFFFVYCKLKLIFYEINKNHQLWDADPVLMGSNVFFHYHYK